MSSSSHSKSWWSRSKAPKDAPSLHLQASGSSLATDARSQASSSSRGAPKPREHSAGSKFNSFVASAMGKKHKRPTLTIQDPPPPLLTSYSTTASLRSANSPSSTVTSIQTPWHRPPVKSVAGTIRSYEYDIDQASDHHTMSEPRTPSDHPRDRRSYQNSLLTLSDPDPFAAGAIVVSRFDQDPNRLSVYSDSSLLDPHAKRGDFVAANRMSYGSSSSNSHGNGESQARLQPVARVTATSNSNSSSAEKRHNREVSILLDTLPPLDLASQHLQVDLSALAGSSSPRTRAMSAVSSSALPSATSSLPPAQRATQLRPRGMTVAGPSSEPIRRPVPRTQPPPPPLFPGANASASASSSPSPSVSAIPPRLARQASADHFARSGSPAAASTSTASPIMFSSARSSLSTVSAHSTPPPPPTRPLVLVRKASSSRVGLPTAPPSTKLPPPPSLYPASEVDEVSIDTLAFPDVPSSSSSTLSFASMGVGMDIDMLGTDEFIHFIRDGFEDEDDEGDVPERGMRQTQGQRQPKASSSSSASASSSHTATTTMLSSPPPPPTPTRLLKKAASQQNMGLHGGSGSGRRQSEMSISSVASSSFDEVASTFSSLSQSQKAPRKQRSFHHPRPRLPLPSLPPIRNPMSSYNNTAREEQPQSPPTPRRRLFSGSSGRLSSGKTTQQDDDVRSVFSLEGSKESVSSHSRESAATMNAMTRQRGVMMSFSNMGNQYSLVTESTASWDDFSSGSVVSHANAHTLSPASGSVGQQNVNVNRTSQQQTQQQTDYVPQHIMSPADMLKLEEELANEAVVRERWRGSGMSVGEWGRDGGEHGREGKEESLRSTPRLELDPGDFGMTFVDGAASGSGNGGSSGMGARRMGRSRTNSTMSAQSTASAATLAFGPATGSAVEDSNPSLSLRTTHSRNGGAPPPSSFVPPPNTNHNTSPRRPATAEAYITPTPTSAKLEQGYSPFRSVSMLARAALPMSKPKTSSSPPPPTRPSTAQPSFTLALSSPSPPSSPYKSSPDRPSVSLPPPPRPRARPKPKVQQQSQSQSEEEKPTLYKRVSIAPFNPLTPPPRRRPVVRPVATLEEELQPQLAKMPPQIQPMVGFSLSPPNSTALSMSPPTSTALSVSMQADRMSVATSRSVPAPKTGSSSASTYSGHSSSIASSSSTINMATTPMSRPPSAFNPQKALNRRSIMRKPSFLDFDGEEEDEDEDEENAEEGQFDVDAFGVVGVVGLGVATSSSIMMGPTITTTTTMIATTSTSIASPVEVELESSFLEMGGGKDSFDTIRTPGDGFF